MKNADKEYMGRVAQLECVNCGAQPVEVHHVREGQGMAQRASNYLTIPLCPSCHRGPRGLHGDRTAFLLKKLDEMQMLALTIERMQRGT
jgi:hypothetical protein